MTHEELEEQVRVLSERLLKYVNIVEEHEVRLGMLEGRRSPLDDEIDFDVLGSIRTSTPSEPVQRDSEWDKMDKLDDEIDAELRRNP